MQRLGCLFLLLLACGCSSLLPHSNNETASVFASFDDARTTIESLQPFVSDVETLKKARIDPHKQPNTAILAYVDIVRRFLPGPAIERKDLDPGIQACLDAREACSGWELNISRISRKRVGNFFLDFINFSRRTETSGWRFSAIILIANNRVVYRAWSGQPHVDEVEVNTNPLGPLQEVGPGVFRR